MRFSVLAIVVVISVSCRSDEYSGVSQKTLLDTFIREIPTYQSGEPTGDYHFKRRVEGLLNLENIENGVDSLEIRIWYSYSFIDTAQLIILKKKPKHEWECFLYTFSYKYKPENDSIVSLNYWGQKAVPKSGWRNLILALQENNIFELPDETKLKNYMHSTDEVGVTVEISDSKQYRIYGYASPTAHKKEFNEARRMSQIILLLWHEFDFSPLVDL
jgi:hypothetical protein